MFFRTGGNFRWGIVGGPRTLDTNKLHTRGYQKIVPDAMIIPNFVGLFSNLPIILWTIFASHSKKKKFSGCFSNPVKIEIKTGKTSRVLQQNRYCQILTFLTRQEKTRKSPTLGNVCDSNKISNFTRLILQQSFL